MEDNKYKMVEYLDEPERILFFTVDEFLGLMIPIAIGLKTHHMLFGLLGGILLLYLLNKLKVKRGNDGDSFIQRIMYWYFPSRISKLKYIPPSFLRSFMG